MKKSLLLIFLLFNTTIVTHSQTNFKKFSEYSTTKNVIDLTKYLPSGYVKDGSIDYTKYIQKGLDENKNVLFPNFPIMVNIWGLGLHSGQNVFFNINSALYVEKNDSQSYRILRMNNMSNIKIYNPRIIGDKKRRKDNFGQWGMGLSIRGAQNIKVYNPIISDCWGDGIYINSYNDIECNNILILGGLLDGNRRNGISIISGNRITVKDITIINTGPQNPQSGIDIEPNTNKDILKKIKLIDVKTRSNGLHGIVVSPGSIKGKNKKSIDIEIINHVDNGSKIGLGIALERLNSRKKNLLSGKPVKGRVIIRNSKSTNNRINTMVNYGVDDDNIKLLIE